MQAHVRGSRTSSSRVTLTFNSQLLSTVVSGRAIDRIHFLLSIRRVRTVHPRSHIKTPALETSPHSAILWKMKRLIHLITIIGLATSVAMAQNEKKEESKDTKADSKPARANEVAVIKTSQGDMVVEFWSDVAPKTVENFKKLARSGFYDGTAFHRIIKGFMIQGGDPLTKDPTKEAMYGTGDPGYKINAEFNERKHVKGVLSMARSGDPAERFGQMPGPQYANSAGSQFFICLGPATSLDGRYTTFGKLIKGEDVLEKIGDAPVEAHGREKSKPTQRVEIQSIKIVPSDSIK
jgi:peptidyl-prolyl cis-trans isomerase B (cyclophilin B)